MDKQIVVLLLSSIFVINSQEANAAPDSSDTESLGSARNQISWVHSWLMGGASDVTPSLPTTAQETVSQIQNMTSAPVNQTQSSWSKILGKISPNITMLDSSLSGTILKITTTYFSCKDNCVLHVIKELIHLIFVALKFSA